MASYFFLRIAGVIEIRVGCIFSGATEGPPPRLQYGGPSVAPQKGGWGFNHVCVYRNPVSATIDAKSARASSQWRMGRPTAREKGSMSNTL